MLIRMIFTQAREVDGQFMRLDAGLEYDLPVAYAKEFLDEGTAHETEEKLQLSVAQATGRRVKIPSERKVKNGRSKTRNRSDK